MKQQPPLLRRATGLLLAAAALPLAPLAAQETQTAPDTPVVDQAPPAGTTTADPAPVTTPEPVTVTPEAVTPAATSTAPAQTTTRTSTTRRTAPARTTAATRTTVRTTPSAPSARVATPAPAPVAEAPAPAATAPETPAAPEVLPAPEALPVTTAPEPEQAQQEKGSMLPWLVGGLLLVGALAFLLMRRRRRDTLVDDEVYEPAPVVEPEPVMAAPLAAAPAAPLAAETGRPWLDLELRPARAGVTGQEAQVEFELIVRNNGNALARDVYVSTWMVAGGATPESEMERLLIDRPAEAGEASLPAVEIEAGATKRIETAVALSTAGLETDAVLPVVVAEATYTLPDGSQGRTSARYAVSVPFGEELSHFDIENPSGLHEGVEAWPLGEVERA
jgi:hypothetical protein